MIQPTHLKDLLDSDRVSLLALAISATIDAQIGGISVRTHPGKLDIYDVVSGDLVRAPGILLGWTQIKSMREAAGHYALPVEFAAYVVAEDYADTARRRKVKRETVAQAIGTQLLALLNDPDHADWGLAEVGLPLADPAPSFRPMFTAKAYKKGTAYYAVTWTQEILGVGPDFLAGTTPAFVSTENERGPGVKFADENSIPAEIAAMIREDGQ